MLIVYTQAASTILAVLKNKFDYRFLIKNAELFESYSLIITQCFKH